MVRIVEERGSVGIEPGLHHLNGTFISLDYHQSRRTTFIVEKIVRKIIQAMKKDCPTFDFLYKRVLGTGSYYEDLKVVQPDEYDIDVVLKLPENITPVVKESNIPGYVNILLENFEKLRDGDAEIYNEMKMFVDDNNYILTTGLKSFIQSRIDRVLSSEFPNKSISIGSSEYQITRVQSLGPAFSFTVDVEYDFQVLIDVVPCIVFNNEHWPRNGFRRDPYPNRGDPFFVVPKGPQRDVDHIDRHWRLSFYIQERIIIFNRAWLKPCVRVLKCVRDYFGHRISSYAIKTMFLWQLLRGSPRLNTHTPEFWLSSFSHIVVYMLERYADHLGAHNVPYFWNKKRNLLDNLTTHQMDNYRNDIKNMLLDLEECPCFDTIIKYFNIDTDSSYLTTSYPGKALSFVQC